MSRQFQVLMRQARLNAGFSQRQVAQALGVSGTSVYMWESGRSQPSLGHLVAIERLFGLPQGMLILPCGYAD